MTINREHLEELELALDRWNDGGPSVQYAALLHDLIAQAQAAPEAEPVAIGETCRGHSAGVIFYTYLPYPPDGTKLYAAPQHDAALVELLAEVRRRVPLPDWARARIDAKLATLSANNEGGKV